MRLTIYVPDRDKHGNPIPPDGVNGIVRKVASLAGGCSVSPVKGYYINQEGQLIEENTLLVWTFTDDEEKIINEFIRWGELTNQESLLVEKDGEPEFIQIGGE